MLNPQDPSSDKPFSVFEFYELQGLAHGAADLFAAGRAGATKRVGEFAAVLRVFKHQRPDSISEIIIVLPPHSYRPEVLGLIKDEFASAISRLQGAPIEESRVDRIFQSVRVLDSERLQAESVLELIRKAKPYTAFVIEDAALYRIAGISSSTEPDPLPEDVWVAHLHKFIECAVEASKAPPCYVVFDAGEAFPTRRTNRDLLLSLDGCAVAGGEDVIENERLATGKRWHQMASGGNLEMALAEIDVTDALSERDKLLNRLQLFNLAGLSNETRATLENNPTLVADLHAELALHVALLAEQADANGIAEKLLGQLVGELSNHEQLASALRLAVRLGVSALTTASEAAMSNLFPNSPVLKRHRAAGLAQRRHFREALGELRDDSSPESEELAGFYRLLEDHLKDGVSTSIPTFTEAVRAQFPARIDEATFAYAAQLEAEDRRPDALTLLMELTSSDGAVADSTAQGILGLIQRDRLSKDPRIDKDLAMQAFEAVVVGLSRRPKDSHTRVRLLRSISPQASGFAGSAMMAMVLMSLAGRAVKVRNALPLDQRARPCSGEALSGLLSRAAPWFGRNKTHILGSRTFPVELLQIRPDEAIEALSNLIEHMTPRIGDEGDLRGFQLALMLAVAIVPLGSDPNADLVILRIAAGKLAHAGHMQLARDLVQHALNAAGDDPYRARLAWFAYADIYHRLANLDEALIACACMLATESEPAWDQVWYESMLVLRLFRDLGLAEFTQPLLAIARESQKHLGLEDRQSARLETVELQLELLGLKKTSQIDPVELQVITTRVMMNVRKVLELNDELDPACMLLASVLHISDEVRAEAPSDAESLLTTALERLPPKSRAFIAIAVYPNWTRHFGIFSMIHKGDRFNGDTSAGFGRSQGLHCRL